jgi:hypothetical protein
MKTKADGERQRKGFGERFERPKPGIFRPLANVPNEVHSDRPLLERSRSRHNNFMKPQRFGGADSELSTGSSVVTSINHLERIFIGQVF